MNDCQRCQQHLIDYINGGLSPWLSRDVAAHIRECDTCYTVYVQQRDTAHRLENELALFGRAQESQLKNIWADVEAALDQPPPVAQQHSMHWWQGSVLAALMLICVLPWTLHATRLTRPVARPAMIVNAPNSHTPDGTAVSAAQVMVVADERPTEDAAPPTPTSTPAVAPVPDDAG